MRNDDNNSNCELRSGRGKRTVLRDNLESIAIAVLLVLIMRQMVVEAFKIPTGSMAPTLVGIHREVRCPNCGTVFRVGNDKLGNHGEIICSGCAYEWPGAGDEVLSGHESEPVAFQNPPWLWHRGHTAVGRRRIEGAEAANRIDRMGSRIFVNKFVYRMRPPRRWELAVFDYPFGDKNYIKRIVGLPGERVAIRDGNVFVDGDIARKPQHVQQGLWIEVMDTDRLPRRILEPRWDFGGRAGMWVHNEEKTGALQVDSRSSDSPLYARYARPVQDFYAYNGINNRVGRSAQNEVNEVKIHAEVEVKEAAKEASFLSLRAGGGRHDFRVDIPIQGSGRSQTVVYDGEEKIKKLDSKALEVGAKHVLVLERYDRTLAARLDGETLFRYYYSTPARARRYDQFIGLGAGGAEAIFERVKLFRDIYYLPGRNAEEGSEYVMEDGSYFVLGDNSPYSSDSREWASPEVPEENLIGRAFAVFWPLHDIELLPAGEKEP